MPSARPLLAASLLLALLAGCLQPDDAALYLCEASQRCPELFTCNAEGYCIRDDAGLRPPTDASWLLDASRRLDASHLDDASVPEPPDADLVPRKDAATVVHSDGAVLVPVDATVVVASDASLVPPDASLTPPDAAIVVIGVDGSVISSPDSGFQPYCGGMSQLCCPGGSGCGPGLVCANGLCTACGNLGLPCCNGGTCVGPAVVCNPAGNCAQCGLLGSPCCPGDKTLPACDAPYDCRKGSCAMCGRENEPPCDKTVPCAPGFALSATGQCTSCGTHGKPCCPGGGCPIGCCDLPDANGIRLCIADMALCPESGFSCQGGRCSSVSDCSYPGGECCKYSLAGTESIACTAAVPLACVSSRCQVCGTLDGPCCLGNVCLGPGLVCDAAQEKCVACGQPASSSTTTANACCPDNVCVGGCCSNGSCVLPTTPCAGEGVCSASGACTACGEALCCPSGMCLDSGKRCGGGLCLSSP